MVTPADAAAVADMYAATVAFHAGGLPHLTWGLVAVLVVVGVVTYGFGRLLTWAVGFLPRPLEYGVHAALLALSAYIVAAPIFN